MRPKRYYLSGNKGSEAPSNFLFFDTESHYRGEKPARGVTIHRLKLWTAIACRLENGQITREERRDGTTAESFFEFVEHRQSKHRPLWCFAHNLGFDLTLLNFWRELEKGTFTIGPLARPEHPRTGKSRPPWVGRLCLEGRPTFAVVRTKIGTCRFVDTGNYWPTRLSAIGEKFGLPKLDIDFGTATDAMLRTYCYRDAEICQRAICDLIDRWTKEECGVFQMTAASLALTNWKHVCPIRKPKTDKIDVLMEPGHPAAALERRGYYGGRVEPFYLGEVKEPVYLLDVNSLYLGMMGDNLFPKRRLRAAHRCTPKELRQSLWALGAIADVCIKSNTETYPLRPHGVQLHARGHFHTTLAGPELKRALDNGNVVSVGECWLYVMDKLFHKWANYWYERKLEATTGPLANEADAEFAKLVGNSLSGKFGQHGDYWKDKPELPCMMPWGQWSVTDHVAETQSWRRGIAGKTQERVRGADPMHSFPAISAYITSYAREYMRTIFKVCPDQSVYYTATDSLICSSEAFRALEGIGKIHPSTIGELKVKGQYESASIHGCNHYRLGEWVIRSGTVAKARPGEGGVLVADIWQGLPSILSARPRGEVIVNHVPVLAHEPTPKGLRGLDGWVEPYFLTPDPDFTDTPPKQRKNNMPIPH